MVGQWVLNCDVSDHCPIILKSGSQNWGPKPFRFNNCWLDHNGFKKMVEKVWNELRIDGWSAYVLKEKLKLLQGEIKTWNWEVFGNVDTKIKKMEEEISNLDKKAENVGLSEVEVNERRSKFAELWMSLNAKECLLRQKSGAQWIKEGDLNASFFHACLAIRRRRNQVVAIRVDDLWVEEVEQFKHEIVKHFNNLYLEEVEERPTLEGIPFKRLTTGESIMLVNSFSLEEVEEIVHSFDGNKSPGLDGYNFKFIQTFWSLIKEEVWGMINDFFASGRLPMSFSSYFVALIPKVKNPQCLNEVRQISLLGCLYKIISKLLAGRLKKVLDSIISNNQFAFLANRNILDGVVVINEVVDFVRKTRKNCFILKIDFEKAYDSVNWKFLDFMMVRLGFCVRRMSWIRECICLGRCSVLVNGSPTKEFLIQKGLKQGDPLAPFLYMMVAEGLINAECDIIRKVQMV